MRVYRGPLERRIEREIAMGGIGLAGFEDDAQMGELGLKLGKKLKKLGKKVGKVVKKVAPIAVAGAALYFGGPIAAKAIKKVGSKVFGGRPQVAAAQQVAAEAIQDGALPAQPAAPATGPSLLDTAATIATAALARDGIQMRSPEAQEIVRDSLRSERPARRRSGGADASYSQAMYPQAQYPMAPQADAGEPAAWKQYLPWIGGGAALLLGAVLMASSSKRKGA